jgi:hypothetical protein
MGAITAKVFQAGKSKALRLPRSLAVKAKTYEVTPAPDGFMVIAPVAVVGINSPGEQMGWKLLHRVELPGLR